MDEFEGTVDLEINGQLEDNVEEVEIQEHEGRGTVELMNKTGFFEKTKRYKLKVVYSPPKSGGRDWWELKDGTVTVDHKGGRRQTFKGATTLKVGAIKFDGKDAAKQDIEIMATGEA